MFPAALVTKDISPKIKFVPEFIIIATPIDNSNMIGSNHDVVVTNRTNKVNGTAIITILPISFVVDSVATTVSTTVPENALSSPIKSLISFTASILLLSSTVTVNKAFPSM